MVGPARDAVPQPGAASALSVPSLLAYIVYLTTLMLTIAAPAIGMSRSQNGSCISAPLAELMSSRSRVCSQPSQSRSQICTRAFAPASSGRRRSCDRRRLVRAGSPWPRVHAVQRLHDPRVGDLGY